VVALVMEGGPHPSRPMRVPFGMSEPLVDQVRAHVVVTPHDIQVINKWLLKGSRNAGLRRWRAIGIGANFVFGMALGAAALVDIRAVAILVPVALMVLAQTVVQRAGAAAMAEHSTGELVVDRTGFGIRRPDGSSYWYQWLSMLEVTPTVDHILIREFDIVGGVIPRRCLAPGDAERIVAFAADALVGSH
jgi:hypothetical protein